MKSTHSQRLEQWLGAEQVNSLSAAMLDWYGPPIAVQGVPGNVYACGGGDFRGRIDAGVEVSAIEIAEQKLRKSDKLRRLWHGMQRKQAGMAGFTSLSDLISEASAGKKRDFAFLKNGATGVIAVTNSLWGLGAQPAAGAASSAAPGGIAPTQATTGAFTLEAVTTDTRHFVYGAVSASVANNLLMYDRIFGVAKTMNSVGTETVSGVPTRYQSITPGNADYAGGNFLFVEVGGTQLANTAHNWTVCTYTDQDGNTGATLPSLTGNAQAIVRRLDHPVGQWFAPLATGDFGIKALTQMQCSALVATGAIDFVIGHPIAWFPCPVANLVCTVDGINTAFNLTRIFDDAALAFLEVTKSATTATNYTGMFTTVHG